MSECNDYKNTLKAYKFKFSEAQSKKFEAAEQELKKLQDDRGKITFKTPPTSEENPETIEEEKPKSKMSVTVIVVIVLSCVLAVIIIGLLILRFKQIRNTPETEEIHLRRKKYV